MRLTLLSIALEALRNALYKFKTYLLAIHFYEWQHNIADSRSY